MSLLNAAARLYRGIVCCCEPVPDWVAVPMQHCMLLRAAMGPYPTGWLCQFTGFADAESAPEERGAMRQGEGKEGGRSPRVTTHQWTASLTTRWVGDPLCLFATAWQSKTLGSPKPLLIKNNPLQGVKCLILEEENGYNGSDESSELSRMFPGALGVSECPDDDEWEISPPTAQLVQGFLLYKRLAPVPRGSYDWMVWFWELVCLLTAKGCYRALLDCAEVAPHDGTHVPWEGEFTCSASMADIAVYLTANGITPHEADDALVWARRAGNEYITCTVNNGGEQDPNTRAALDLLRVAINDPPVMKENRSKEWVEHQARTLRIATKRIVAYEACPLNDTELPIIRDFCTAVVLYDLPNYPGVEGRVSWERTPNKNEEPKEGEMRDEPAPM
ncbi:hypothetical protein EDD15DRAFT_2200507 [Pisolithus albus]|nr:hypothetical protein EDD15DRAFT_2200507 [Pisolithus albus]